MKIVAALFPRFTAIDLIGPVNCWNFLPGADIQLAALAPPPVLAAANAILAREMPDALVEQAAARRAGAR